jgi:hypothetical protein
MSEDATSAEPGDVLYDEDGDVVGVVDGVTEDGVEVRTTDSPEAVAHEEEPGQSFGEGHLVWRCDDCGEVGDLEGGMPDACPNCDAPREALYRAEED